MTPTGEKKKMNEKENSSSERELKANLNKVIDEIREIAHVIAEQGAIPEKPSGDHIDRVMQSLIDLPTRIKELKDDREFKSAIEVIGDVVANSFGIRLPLKEQDAETVLDTAIREYRKKIALESERELADLLNQEPQKEEDMTEAEMDEALGFEK